MKKLFTLIVVVCYTQLCFSQAPQGFSYQAVARDNNGNPKANTSVSVKFSILSGSAEGAVVYAETYQTQSNNFGLFNLVIGQGQVLSGNFFSTIDWAGPKFLKVEIDGMLSSTTQLLSVPYALYAEKAKPDLKAGTGIAVSGNEISNTGDLSATNEIQTLNLSGNTISLSNGGGSVNLPSVTSSQWRDTTGLRKGIYYNGPILAGLKASFGNDASLIIGQENADPNRNLITLLTRRYNNRNTDFQFYAYPDEPTVSAYLRGMAMIYSPNDNNGLQFAAANGVLRFHTGGFASESSERLRIALNGNIGIGTSSPAAKLQVNDGDVYIEDFSRGVIMKSSDGSCWRMTVSTAGAPIMTKITCPN